MSDGEILRTFPELPLNKRLLLAIAFDDDDVTDRLNAIRTRYSPSEQIKIWKHTEPVMFPELPISQLDLYHETFNRIVCSQRKSVRLGRGQFEFYESKNDPRPGMLILRVPVTTDLRDIYDEALASFRGKVVIKELAVRYFNFRPIIPVYDQPSSIEAQKMLVALKRDYALGVDLGLLKRFRLYRLARESFSGAPGTLTTGDIKGHALLKEWFFQDVEGED
jgi:hypothetical protein